MEDVIVVSDWKNEVAPDLNKEAWKECESISPLGHNSQFNRYEKVDCKMNQRIENVQG